ncbi:transcription factor iiib 70 kda subunit [Quercus suber]|uniref:Transcription factor iiib 70 kDa subunit n=1 Tax=Quercus suber TaxID=58331 RepID=A0AAW0KZY7_QUESU
MALFLSCANGNHRPTSSYANGLVCCDVCGKVLHEDLYTDEPSFVKGAGGESKLSGSVVRSIQSGYSESFRRTLDKGRDMIESIVTTFNISGGDSIVNPACAFYQIAVERNFTRGRKTDQVAAACLYIACRYVLGAVFLQLCQLLSLGEHPTIIKPVDPSLYISRFTESKDLLFIV